MIYSYGIIVGLMIVTGQVLWKYGIEKLSETVTVSSLFSTQILKIISSPYIVLGVVSYGFATLFYMALLSKFEYTDLQTVVVSSSLIITFIAAAVLFNEKISAYNLVGVVLLLCGVLLITKL